MPPCLDLSKYYIDYIDFYAERKKLEVNSLRSGVGSNVFMMAGFGSGSAPPGSATLLMLTILTKDSSIFDFNYLDYIYSGNNPTPDDSNDTQESNLHSGKLRLAYFFFVIVKTVNHICIMLKFLNL